MCVTKDLVNEVKGVIYLSPRDYLKKMRDFMRSELNIYYTGQVNGPINPGSLGDDCLLCKVEEDGRIVDQEFNEDRNRLAENFIKNGGLDEFKKMYKMESERPEVSLKEQKGA